MEEQPYQLPNAFYFSAHDATMYFIHRPGKGWQLTPRINPEVAIAEFDQLTTPIRNDYLTFHRMVEAVQKPPHPPKTVKQQIMEIRDEHIISLASIRSNPWLSEKRRAKFPKFDELDGVKIDVAKCLHWTSMHIFHYKELCRIERLAVQGVVYSSKFGKKESARYTDALATVFPEEWAQQKADNNQIHTGYGNFASDYEQQRQQQQTGDNVFDPKNMIFEDAEERYFPGGVFLGKDRY